MEDSSCGYIVCLCVQLFFKTFRLKIRKRKIRIIVSYYLYRQNYKFTRHLLQSSLYIISCSYIYMRVSLFACMCVLSTCVPIKCCSNWLWMKISLLSSTCFAFFFPSVLTILLSDLLDPSDLPGAALLLQGRESVVLCT